MPDRTVSEMELRENARLAADDTVARLLTAVKTNEAPERIEALSAALNALDNCAAEPG